MSGLVGPRKPHRVSYDPDARLGPDHAAVEFLARFILETEPRTYLSSVDFATRLPISRTVAGQILGELRDSTISPLEVSDERGGAHGRKKFRIEFNDREPWP